MWGQPPSAVRRPSPIGPLPFGTPHSEHALLAPSVTSYPPLRSNNLVNVVGSSDKGSLDARRGSRAARITDNPFTSSIQGDGNGNAWSIEAPAEGPVIQREKMDLLQFLQHSGKPLAADRVSLAVTSGKHFPDILHRAVAVNRDDVRRTTPEAWPSRHLHLCRLHI